MSEEPEEKEIPLSSLTFEDGVMLMKTFFLKLLTDCREMYPDFEGIIDDLETDVTEKTNNNVLLDGYLYPRADQLIEQFDIFTEDEE